MNIGPINGDTSHTKYKGIDFDKEMSNFNKKRSDFHILPIHLEIGIFYIGGERDHLILEITILELPPIKMCQITSI